MKFFLTFGTVIVLCNTPVMPALLCGQTTFAEQQNAYQRVRQARENRAQQIDSLFRSNGIAYPPKEILLIAYKHERVLELWARSDTHAFSIIKRYPFTAFSGTLGPKRKEGDLQIPEGLYYIDHFNPFSAFHLSMKINYPNASDRILGGRGRLGGEIRIHGSSVTIGCIPIGDESIEELYIICVDTRSAGQNRIPVYIFPARMHWTGMHMLEAQAGEDTVLLSFWHDLWEAYTVFQVSHHELRFTVDDRGQYVFTEDPRCTYAWTDEYDGHHSLASRIPAPPGYERIKVPSWSFAGWLRGLPLKPGTPPVYLYTGARKTFQAGHHAVVDMDVGHADLQQCADALMRLFAEYTYQIRDLEHIAFQITNGDTPDFMTWAAGSRPQVDGNTVTWQRTKTPDSSYAALKQYLQFIFTYAGSFSLQQQLRKVVDINDMQIGDIFIQGGFPGHAVMVCDMAYNEQTGDTVFLLVQSYMPAQDIHVLKNLSDPALNPWYRLYFGDTLYTPEWTFTKNDLKRW